MSDYTVSSDTPFPLVAWLLHDDYDHNDDPLTISATEFNQSIRQNILSKRAAANPFKEKQALESLTASRIGSAIHAAIEAAVSDPDNREAAARLLGLPKRVAANIVVNPEKVEKGTFPVYMEQRITRKLGKYTISGKYDMVFNNQLMDFKSTGTYTYVKQTSAKDYIRQGSIYRWIDNGNIITSSILQIGYIFRDWSAGQTYQDNYPPAAVVGQNYQLESPDSIQQFMETYLKQLETYSEADEADIPYCTPEEMWQDPPVYKYYPNPENRKRSAKNFNNYDEAQRYFVQKGSVGVMAEVQGKPRKCAYCDGRMLCSQYQAIIAKEE